MCGVEEGMEVVQTQGEHGERRRRAELELVEANIATAAAAALASAATKAKVSLIKTKPQTSLHLFYTRSMHTRSMHTRVEFTVFYDRRPFHTFSRDPVGFF